MESIKEKGKNYDCVNTEIWEIDTIPCNLSLIRFFALSLLCVCALGELREAVKCTLKVPSLQEPARVER